MQNREKAEKSIQINQSICILQQEAWKSQKIVVYLNNLKENYHFVCFSNSSLKNVWRKLHVSMTDVKDKCYLNIKNKI